VVDEALVTGPPGDHPVTLSYRRVTSVARSIAAALLPRDEVIWRGPSSWERSTIRRTSAARCRRCALARV